MSGISPEPGVWQEDFKVHSYEVDFHHRATLLALCRYYQEAAWNHAERLGVGFHQLVSQSRLWVLSRFAVAIDRWPEWNQTITIQTWPRTAKSLFAMRDFEMFDSAGTRIGAAASAWLILDAASRKPLRSDRWLGTFTTLSRRSLPDDPQKLPACDGDSRGSVATVGYTDIDVNSHVNNTRYIGWMLDAYPMSFYQQHSTAILEVNFLGEARFGDSLETRVFETGPLERHHAIRTAAGQEVCRARILWRVDLDPPGNIG